MRRRHLGRRAGLAVAVMTAGAVAAMAQTDHSFMPKGGNVLLQQIFAQAPAADLQAVLSTKHSAAEWQDLLRPRAEGLSDHEQQTLGTYLENNLPLPADAVAQVTAAKLATALPPDGDELAWNYCGSCHSLFSGYLMQDRDQKGWQAIFLSPFHRGVRMTAQERATFAGYSAINMPLPRDKVPPDLRF